jgi:LmbE family N-acetylglucosaminyl deacetylase
LKILIVCAHPDDETIGMGGTLKKLSKTHDVTVLFVAEGITARRKSGFKNHPVYDVTHEEMEKMKEEIEIRKVHAKEALKILGVTKMRFLDLPNEELDQVPLLRIIKEIEKEIDETQCEIIFTHHFNDLNLDHRVVYDATITAARPLPGSSVSMIASFEIPASTDWKTPYQFKPNLFVNISDELESKVNALKAYHYEIRKSPHPRSKEMTEAGALRWGSLSGYNASEAFEIIRLQINDISKISI